MHQRGGEIQEKKGVIYDLAPNLEVHHKADDYTMENKME